MSTFSYFVDKLSPELRVMIYGYVFGPAHHIERLSDENEAASQDNRLVLDDVSSMPHAPVMVSTSILATNKLIFAEAAKKLYISKTVRLTPKQLSDEKQWGYINDIRRLQIVSLASVQSLQELSECVAIITAPQARRLRELALLSDDLAYDIPSKSHITVRSWAEAFGTKVACVDIGKYELFGSGITIFNSKVTRLWPLAATLPNDYDALTELEQVMLGWGAEVPPLNRAAWAAQTSFRIWVGMLEAWLEYRKHPQGPDLQDKKGSRRDFHLKSWAISAGEAVYSGLDLQGADGRTVRVLDLRPGHDAATLEAVTEFIAQNTETYMHLAERDDHAEGLAKARWPEIESGEGIGASTARKLAAKTAAWEAGNIIPHPFYEGGRFKKKDVRLLVLSDPKYTTVFGEHTIRDAGIEELQQVLCLLLALGYCGGDPEKDDHDRAQRKEWSLHLLLAYIERMTVPFGADLELPDTATYGHIRGFVDTMFEGIACLRVQPALSGTIASTILDSLRNSVQAVDYEVDEVAGRAPQLYKPFVEKLSGFLCWLAYTAVVEEGGGSEAQRFLHQEAVAHGMPRLVEGKRVLPAGGGWKAGRGSRQVVTLRG